MKYPASSSYLLTRFVLMKTSSPLTFTAFLTLAKARRCYFSNSRAASQFTATLTTILLTRDVRRGDPYSNGLCRFSLFRNVGASTWLRLWLYLRLSTCCAEVVLTTLPNVSIASINLDVAGLEGMRPYLTMVCHAHE